MDAPWPAGVGTAPSSCGTWQVGAVFRHSQGIPTEWAPWSGARMGDSWPVAAVMKRSGSGTSNWAAIGRHCTGIQPVCVARSFHHGRNRSEEHTSELHSHLNLLCRLLLEK